MRTLAFVMLAFLPLTSCVSVKFAPDVQKAKEVTHPTLPKHFSAIQLPPADHAWKSDRTGNTISYFSECTNTPLALERMREDVLASLPKAKIVSSQDVMFDDREALDSVIEGSLEGIPVRLSLLVYLRNGCRYSLSYTGRAVNFDQELSEFQSFKQGFRAP